MTDASDNNKKDAQTIGDAFRALNDALYVPAIFSALLLTVVLFWGNSATDHGRRWSIAKVLIALALAQLAIGFFHNQLKWRHIHSTPDKSEKLSDCEFRSVIGLHAFAVIIAIVLIFFYCQSHPAHPGPRFDMTLQIR